MAAQTPVFKEHGVAMAFPPGQAWGKAVEKHADEQLFLPPHGILPGPHQDAQSATPGP